MKIFKLSVVVVLAITIMIGLAGSISAATTVDLGTADTFAVLAGSAVTDVPNSVISGNVGLSPAAGTNYAGLTKSEVSGTIYAVDVTGPAGAAGNNPSLVNGAQSDLTTAYLDAAGRTPTTTFVTGDNQLGGQTLTPGVYAFGHAATANITAASPLTLDAQGNNNAVFIFQASSDLVTASNSVVKLVNGARACNIFWQVSSSVTLGTNSTFFGNILALTSITDNGRSTVTGSLLARNGQVALNMTTITKVRCSVTSAPSSTPNTITITTPTPNTTTITTPKTTTSRGPSSTTATVTQLPNTGVHTGISTYANSIPRNVAILLAGIFTVLILFKVTRRKN